jgi:hypothetical protein
MVSAKFTKQPMTTRLPFALMLCLGMLAALAGCKEDQPDPTPKLPAETQTGAGTLGFKIGDKIYVATSATGRIRQVSDNTIVIESGNGTEDWGFSVQADSIYSAGIYIIDTLQVAPFTITSPGGSLIERCVHQTFLAPNIGKLTITRYDPTARVLSGRFEMTMFSDATQCPSTINVTDGRFDVKF